MKDDAPQLAINRRGNVNVKPIRGGSACTCGREKLEAGACLKSARLKSVQNRARFRHDNFSFRDVPRARFPNCRSDRASDVYVRHNRLSAKIIRFLVALRIVLSSEYHAGEYRAARTGEHGMETDLIRVWCPQLIFRRCDALTAVH